MAATGLVGSTLGEQAARSATPAKGMISIKRRRLVDVDMVGPVESKNEWSGETRTGFPVTDMILTRSRPVCALAHGCGDP
jgi:hypothetical protein